MNKKSRFICSALMIAAVNVLLRAAAVSFNAYVSLKIGSESMGLFTLTMNVYGFAVTLAVSGVGLAAMRLTAERSAILEAAGADRRSHSRSTARIMGCCIAYSLLFSIPTSVLLWFTSPLIGKYLLCDLRCVLSLKVLAVSLVPISLTAALSGYFTGVRKVYKNAIAAISEQAMKIALTSTLLALSISSFTDKVEYSCLAVVGGAALSEAFSLIVNGALYLLDSKRPAGTVLKDSSVSQRTRFGDTVSIAFPVALGAYVRQGLSTVEHLSIPWGMRIYGADTASTLGVYGVLRGMVFPLILFPSAVLSSAMGLLVPELAESSALRDSGRIGRILEEAFKVSTIFAIGCAAVFFAFSEYFGNGIYQSAEASLYIRLNAPLVAVMYLDISVDCMLKGLGEQVYSMRINVIDSALSLALVLLLVPRFGIMGYIFSVYVCESVNCALSLHRLIKVSGGVGGIAKTILYQLVIAVISICAVSLGRQNTAGRVQNTVMLVACILIYFSLTVAWHVRLRNKARYSGKIKEQ